MTEPHTSLDGLVRVYPAPAPDGSGLVWVHGGGFAGGDIDMPESDAVARALADRGTTVVTVDYRLAGPDTRFPAASDDVLVAWRWTLDNASDLGVDRARLGLGGASAGANLVTGAVLRLLAEGSSALPALLVLAYPTLLAVQPPPDPALRALLDADPDADVFPPDAVLAMYENYLGSPLRGDALAQAPLAAIPGHAIADDLVGFPPTLMINDDADELRVSGEAFAATLQQAGREIEVVVEPGTTHGHLNRPHDAAFAASIDRIADRLARLSTPSHDVFPGGTPA
jgi:acetyl esterase